MYSAFGEDQRKYPYAENGSATPRLLLYAVQQKVRAINALLLKLRAVRGKLTQHFQSTLQVLIFETNFSTGHFVRNRR